MPKIEVSYEDLLALIGKHIPLDELKEKAIFYAKGEIEEVDGVTLKIDIKDANRPDMWSAEGIAREIAGRYGRPGLPEYKVSKSELEVRVDLKAKKVRPYTVCAVVKGLRIDGNVLSQMIQLQEKVAETFGRRRREVAIGVYDYRKIKGPIRYTTVKPDGIKFTPLEFSNPLTPRQILEQHPKGKEYRHLLEGCAEYPIFIDAAGEVLSMPPVINSDYTGKVTSETRDVFIECSGFHIKFLAAALNVLVAAMADRGGVIEGVKVIYPKGYGEVKDPITTPDMRPKQISINSDNVNKLLGLKLAPDQMSKLLGQARYDTKTSGKNMRVTYPAYRQDIMHWRDVAEDIAISYGYSNVKPSQPKLAATGGELEVEVFSRKVAEAIAGLGLQEVLSYVLTSKDNISGKMKMKEGPVVEIENFVSANWSVFRTWLLPSLMEFLSRNKHVEYPQKIFEIGAAIIPDNSRETKARDARKLSCALSNATIGYEDISSLLDAFMSAIGVKYSLRPANHPSFIQGRRAAVIVSGKDIGVVGEIHPEVLNNWGLEKPVAAFEISLDEIFGKIK